MHEENQPNQNHQRENNKTIFSCRFCGEEFLAPADLRAHKNSFHPALVNDLVDLERIKSEIIKEIAPAKKSKGVAWGNTAISAILVLLMIFSVAQAVQSFTIWQKIETGAIKPVNAQATTNTSLPANLNSLPNMVGGC